MKSWIKTELIRYIRNSSYESDFLEIRAKFASRLRARGYPPAFVRSALSQVDYNQRFNLLQTRKKSIDPKKATPLVFVTEWHPQHRHYNLRQSLTLTSSVRGLMPHVRPLIAYKRAQNLGDLINTWFKKSPFYLIPNSNPRVSLLSNPEENLEDGIILRKQQTTTGTMALREMPRPLAIQALDETIDLTQSSPEPSGSPIWLSD